MHSKPPPLLRTGIPCFALFLSAPMAHAQGGNKAQACFFAEDFEGGIPAGWNIGAAVERQTSAGDSLGEFVPAWTVGNAAQANANGFFPVPDLPVGDRFAMANDDAPPCNCTMADVALTTPQIDLTGRSGLALQCRVFHEMTLGAGPAVIEARVNASTWTLLDTIAPTLGAWQDIFLDLSAYDGNTGFELRFRWSDGGGWSSGFAVDDVCLRERLATDLVVLQTHTHDASQSAFLPGDQSLRHSRVPLEQIAPMAVSARILNLGTAATDGAVHAEFLLNGATMHTTSTVPLGPLGAGRDTLIVIPTEWTPNNTGDLEVRIHAEPLATDLDPADNTGMALMRITGPGWEGDYFSMAADENTPTGQVGNADHFIAAVRLETRAGGTAHGIGAGITASSTIGAMVRAILMDANLALVDTSVRHAITQADLDHAASGGLLYLPLAHAPVLGAGDHFAGIQLLADDVEGAVHIATSGARPAGADVLMEGPTFDVTYLSATPMVRLHFADYGVGIEALGTEYRHPLQFYPVPSPGPVQCLVEFPSAGKAYWHIMDLSGRELRRIDLGHLAVGKQRLSLDISDLSQGGYLVELVGGDQRQVGRVVRAD